MMTTAPSLANLDDYLAAFARLAKSRTEPEWLHAIRKTGLAHFSERGFPTPHDEEWRFTNVASLAKLPFQLAGDNARDPGASLAVDDFTFAEWNDQNHLLVFVNGHYSPDLSRIQPEPCGKISSLASALDNALSARLVQQYLAQNARSETNPFIAMNDSFFSDGAFIHILQGQTIDKPIHLLYLTDADGMGVSSQPRNLIVAEENSRACVMEHYVSRKGAIHFTNAVTEIVVGKNAQVEHCKIQQESLDAFHLATIQVQLARNANFTSHSISLGARLSRTDINLVMAGEGIHAILNGLYLGKDDQLVDHHTVADHTMPRCNSHEFYHGILDDRAKGVFNGKIFVRKDAQKTDAKQTSRSLLLSKEATIDTKPQLEIFADDVKCTHGATVGQLDDEAIFYLRSRGIGKEKARAMLVHAFASEILNRITIAPVREQLEAQVEQWLAGKEAARV